MVQPLVGKTKESRKTSESISGTDEFLAIVSHELRNPTNAILGWAELLDRQIHHPGLAKAIDVIRRNALVQAQLLDELIDYSRLGAHTLELKIRVVSLKQIVEAAAEALAPMALQKQIHVSVQLGLSGAEMDGDPTRLQQVFSNLFSNAIKFTPSGGSVRVTLTSTGDCHTITVIDTGEGISAEFLPFVFDRYRQADRTAGRGGLGLGLTIARRIVELHSGTIKAESRGKGEGAAFIVQLPRRAGLQETIKLK
ncbi:MAG TPA: HAMP domain-containing sensor histidine kinase [Pyrinomonadaceae bacterium]|nr:HAMP domain-containing sensor histidine kinase [Pyrinomonadaceae bacterium]